MLDTHWPEWWPNFFIHSCLLDIYFWKPISTNDFLCGLQEIGPWAWCDEMHIERDKQFTPYQLLPTNIMLGAPDIVHTGYSPTVLNVF